MTGRFVDHLVSRQHRFSLGIERGTGQHYLSIPVASQLVDYEEYYRIEPDRFARFMADPAAALPFVERCRRREEDERLIFPRARAAGWEARVVLLPGGARFHDGAQ